MEENFDFFKIISIITKKNNKTTLSRHHLHKEKTMFNLLEKFQINRGITDVLSWDHLQVIELTEISNYQDLT